MEDKLTVDQVLQICINMLGEISIPQKLWEQIGKPIEMVKHNIEQCQDVLRRTVQQAEEDAAQAEAQEEDGEILEIVQEDATPEEEK